MLDNATRKNLLQRSRELGYPGSIMDVYRSYEQGIDVLNDYALQQQEQQMQVAQTPQEQQTGLREEHAQGNTQASMAFPNVQPNQSFNTVGMKAPINIDKYDNQGHLVESHKNVPPGIQDLPTGPYEGTVIESPAAYQKGGIKEYHAGGLYHNINHKKKSGTSRSKSNSTISKEAYANMKSGFKKQKGGFERLQDAQIRRDLGVKREIPNITQEQAEIAGGFIPYLGEAIDAKNVIKSLKSEKYGEAALHGAGFLLPFVPGKLIKKGYQKAKDWIKSTNLGDISIPNPEQITPNTNPFISKKGPKLLGEGQVFYRSTNRPEDIHKPLDFKTRFKKTWWTDRPNQRQVEYPGYLDFYTPSKTRFASPGVPQIQTRFNVKPEEIFHTQKWEPRDLDFKNIQNLQDQGYKLIQTEGTKGDLTSAYQLLPLDKTILQGTRRIKQEGGLKDKLPLQNPGGDLTEKDIKSLADINEVFKQGYLKAYGKDKEYSEYIFENDPNRREDQKTALWPHLYKWQSYKRGWHDAETPQDKSTVRLTQQIMDLSDEDRGNLAVEGSKVAKQFRDLGNISYNPITWAKAIKAYNKADFSGIKPYREKLGYSKDEFVDTLFEIAGDKAPSGKKKNMLRKIIMKQDFQEGGFQYPVVTAQSLNMEEGSGKKVSPFSKNMVFKNTPASTEALDWYKQYVQSPMHYEMLSKEDPKNVDWIAKQRLKNVQNIKMRTHTMPFSKNPLVGGTSLGSTGNINIYPSGLNSGTEIHEVSHSSDRPVGFPYIGVGGGASYFGKRLIPKSSVQLSKPNPLAPQSEIDKGIAEAQYNKDKSRQFQLQDWKDYVTKPTEIRARLNTIRMMAQQQNIYDPFTEKISEDQYQNLLKYKPNFENPTMEPLNQLRDIYNDEQIRHMLNTFSKSEQQPTLLQNTQFAQTGGLRNHMMNYMNTTGRDTTHVNLVMDAIGQHESKNIADRKQDSYKTVDGKRVRYDGPGRGIFQFETGPKEGGNTAINRTANFLKYNTDKSIHDFPNLNKIYNKSNSLDFSTLSKKDQEALFIGDKIFGGKMRRNEFDAITRNRETPPTQEEVFMYWLRNHKGSVGGKPVVIETKDSKGTVIKRELNPNLTKEEIKEEKRRWNNRTKKIFKKNPLYTVKENPVPLKVRIPFKLKRGGYYKKCM